MWLQYAGYSGKEKSFRGLLQQIWSLTVSVFIWVAAAGL